MVLRTDRKRGYNDISYLEPCSSTKRLRLISSALLFVHLVLDSFKQSSQEITKSAILIFLEELSWFFVLDSFLLFLTEQPWLLLQKDFSPLCHTLRSETAVCLSALNDSLNSKCRGQLSENPAKPINLSFINYDYIFWLTGFNLKYYIYFLQLKKKTMTWGLDRS